MLVAYDVETALLDGTPSTEYYRPDFRVVSAAFAWRKDGALKTKYVEGEAAIAKALASLKALGAQLVVHNYQFEYGVTLHRLPGYEDLVAYDTMRLVQVGDNGGKLAQRLAPTLLTYEDMLDAAENGESTATLTGLGLVAGASRWLPPEFRDHKEPFHKWLRDERGVKKGKEGQHLTELPSDMFEAYNVADAEVTLRLYETLTEAFAKDGYDWHLDHQLYLTTARLVAVARGSGMRVDRGALAIYTAKVEDEVAAIERRFREHFAKELILIEGRRADAYIKAVKTTRGQERRRAGLAEDTSPLTFNLGSNKQLKELFVDVMGLPVKFWTKAPKRKKGAPERKTPHVPAPSFKSAHIATYGEGGEILLKRRKRLLVLQQCRALLALSELDGRVHFDVRAAGTSTGRLAGGSL